MKLQIIDNGTGQKEEAIKLLKRYGELSLTFKQRLQKNWQVTLKNGPVVDAHTERQQITIVIPAILKQDTLREVVEAILFECGNAELYTAVFNPSRKKFENADPIAISLIGYATEMSTGEAENFWHYSKGLADLSYNNFVLSFQGRQQLKQKAHTKSVNQWQNNFNAATHNPNSPDPVQRLFSVDLYAYEKIQNTNEFKLQKILKRLVSGGNQTDLYEDTLLGRSAFNNMDAGERIPVWCTVLDIVNKVRALQPNVWVKSAGYDFTERMRQLALLVHFIKPETKQAFNDRLTHIKTELGINVLDTPQWLR